MHSGSVVSIITRMGERKRERWLRKEKLKSLVFGSSRFVPCMGGGKTRKDKSGFRGCPQRLGETSSEGLRKSKAVRIKLFLLFRGGTNTKKKSVRGKRKPLVEGIKMLQKV